MKYPLYSIFLWLCFLFSCQNKSAQTEEHISQHPENDSLSASKMKKSVLFFSSSHSNPNHTNMLSDSLRFHLSELIKSFKKGDSVQIICFGNSITNGYKVGGFGRVAHPYPETLEKMLREHFKNPAIQVINEGHNGWRSLEAIQHLQRIVLDKKPDWVLLKLGINDAYSGLSDATFGNQMRKIIQQILQSGAKVLLLTPTPIHTPYQAKILAYKPILQKIAQENQCAFFDLNEAILKRVKQEHLQLADILPDDVHLADEKYQWISEAIFNFLLQSGE